MQKQVDVLVIGAGHAGFQIVKMLRAQKFEGSIAIVCADNGDYYSKPALSTAFSKKQSPDGLVIQSAEKIQLQFNCEMMTHAEVISLNREDKTLHIQKNQQQSTIQYGKLIIATGAVPKQIAPLEIDNDLVFAINHLDHYRALVDHLKPNAHVVIVGAGLVGSEYANDCIQAGYKVSLVGRKPSVMTSLLPANVGEAVTAHLSDLGVEMYLNNTVQQIVKHDTGARLHLACGQALEADVVISAIGLTPNDMIARTAGLECDKGVVVNQFMQTSDQDIYALGDVAQAGGLNLQYIMPINIGAKVIASHILGLPLSLSYPVMPITIKTTKLPTVVAPPILYDPNEIDWQTEGEGENQIATAYHDQQVIGFAVSGQYMKQRFPLLKQIPAWLPAID
jgi:rubredoxin---NAD+ reductase